MAEPKKQDLIEQYEELVKKRHALEAKKQLALTVGAVDAVSYTHLTLPTKRIV